MESKKTVMAPVSLFSLPRYRSLLPLVFTLLFHLLGCCNGATYHAFDITSDRVCSHLHKRELQTTLSNPVILESRAKTMGKVSSGSPLDCTVEVEVKGGGPRLGVVSVVQRMDFRSQGDYCLDYIQAIYHKKKGIKIPKRKDQTGKILKHAVKKIIKGDRNKRDSDHDNRGPRICGNILFGLHVDQNETMPPPFASPLPPQPPMMESIVLSIIADGRHFNPYRTLVSDASDVDPKGELKTHLYVSNRMLRVNETIKFKSAYTAYQECDGENVPESLFHCGYGMCISRFLVNDGIVNCPFGDCIDETNCTNAKSATITAHVVQYVATQAANTKSWTGTIVLVVICTLICVAAIYLFINKRRAKKKAKAPQGAEEEDDNEDEKDDGEGFVGPSKQQSQPNAGAYYPTHPLPAWGTPGYVPPPGEQPGYYPPGPQQPPPPGYAPLPQQPPPPGYPGAPATEATTGPQVAPYTPVYPPVVAGGPSHPPLTDAALYPSSTTNMQQQGAPLPPGGFAYPPPPAAGEGGGYPPYPSMAYTTAPPPPPSANH